ncbi:hypothetical protein [Xylanimonas ulmi]|uniref:ATP/GTP-binding protein n=1 Tax=Xylanimonas ulmi TaxID=228973 RepID=A0A4Q7M180_9MICO|nr:hypothetical protein [Xylanibacterium ulmi]RZS60683.1 hypothetical protein EV386_0955 [Xylanibacterium ulmi]
MRARILRVILTATATAAAIALIATPIANAADAQCEKWDRQTGHCLVYVSPPAPTLQPVSTDDGAKDSGAGTRCVNDLSIWNSSGGVEPIVCSSSDGQWSNAYGCFMKKLDPQPAPDPRFPRDRPGAVYSCVIPPPHGGSTAIWLENPPDVAAEGPSPREVAQMAVDSMDLHAIEIGMVPEPGPGKVGIVGLPVWMWAANPGVSTTGPNTASASAGGITITATARMERITWDMGDGATVVCDGLGTPYEDRFGKQPSPDCGHTYSTSSAGQPEDRFTVSATSDWVISWEGAGQTGTIRLDGLSNSVQVAIGEVQVLVQP